MHKKIVALTICMIMGMSASTSIKVMAYVNNGWINTNRGWNYYEDNSLKSGWINTNNNWYYMDESGLMKIGWQKIDGSWYFMQDSGEMKTGWLKGNKAWYYLNQSGEMASNTTVDGYYLGVDGAWIENNSDQVKFKNIVMKTEKNTYEIGTQEILINIANNSQQEFFYGAQYEIEKFKENKWVKVPFKEEPMFIEIAYRLEPGKINSEIISLNNLEKLMVGKYRIVKSSGELAAEFEIK